MASKKVLIVYLKEVILLVLYKVLYNKVEYKTQTKYLGTLINQKHVNIHIIYRMLCLYYTLHKSRNINVKQCL